MQLIVGLNQRDHEYWMKLSQQQQNDIETRKRKTNNLKLELKNEILVCWNNKSVKKNNIK